MISFYERELKKINKVILKTAQEDIPKLFSFIPLSLYGLMEYGEYREQYKNINKYLPTMASQETQEGWTGGSGDVLLNQSVDFIRSLVYFYETYTKKDISDANVLDYGCGWGRLTRLLLKYVPENRIFAVDPMENSINECEKHNVRGNFGMIQSLCRELPFNGVKFDLVFAFSVFTHLSEKACEHGLNTIHANINPTSILAITIRSREYWSVHHNNIENINLKNVLREHDRRGFAFVGRGMESDGDMTFGDTSITIDYINRAWDKWQIVGSDISLSDRFQQVVFLKPK